MNVADEVARRHFRGTPLYLETMIATNIVPREIEVVTDIARNFAGDAMTIWTHLYEHDFVTEERVREMFGISP